MVRILLVAPVDGASDAYLSRAFHRAGCDGATYDYREASERLGLDRMRKELVELARGVDIVLILKGEEIDVSTIRFIRANGSKVALWMFDAWIGLQPYIIENARECDAFFTVSRGQIQQYEEVGVAARWLLEAADPNLHKPYHASNQQPALPVSFTGTIDNVAPRLEWLTALRARFGDNLHLFGSYPGVFANANHHGRAEDWCGLEPDDALNYVASTSLVNLDNQRNPELDGTYGARLFRTLAAGGYLVTNVDARRQDFPHCFDSYHQGDWTACGDLVQHGLHDPDYRRKVAERGRRFVLEHHTWDHRAHVILRTLGYRPLRDDSLTMVG